MPIRAITERPRIPIKGVIRLGTREESKSGNLYPTSKEYFVLDDAPEVRKVYGDDPKELDIRFPGNNLDRVLQTWYKLWTPSLKKGNTIEQGRLLCQGDGPLDGTPGVAEWKDRERVPVGDVLSERDPKTGYLKRPCLGSDCPDAFDNRGMPKCKQSMQVFCILPLVSMGDVYVINTSSWGSIRSFHDLLGWHQSAFHPDYIVHNYYKISREEEAIRYYDKREGKQKDSKQFIMKLSHQDREEFELKNLDRLKDRQLQIRASSLSVYLPTNDEADALPMDEIYPMIEAKATTVVDERSKAEVLLDDPEVSAALDTYAKAMGITLDKKGKLLMIRKKENEADIKAAVIEAVNVQLERLKPEQKVEDLV